MKLFSRKIKSDAVVKDKDKKDQVVAEGSVEVEKSQSNSFVMPVVSKSVVRPLLTEKAGVLESKGQYVFLVTPSANKSEVRKEIEKLFNVKVASVNIINKKRKKRMWRGRVGFSAGFKKAIITLVEGYKIEVLPK